MKFIPDEIKTALNQDYGFILLIKGKAGTGKTTLALKILGMVKNPIYISTRINPQLLYSQFPWIKEILLEEYIIDATTFDFKHPLFIDDNLFFQSLHLHNLPNFVRKMFSKMNSESGTVVIDSWDAITTLGETRWGKSQRVLSNYIIELIREKKYNLILISENEDETYLDYLVDGIICLKDSFLDSNKRFRQLQLIKLRGICINQHSYLFTLHNGQFLTFLPGRQISFQQLKRSPIIKDTRSKISTGIPDLDRILTGGLKKGSIILFEMQPYLENDYILFSFRIAMNFLLQKRGVIGLPSSERDASLDVVLMKRILGDKDDYSQYIRIIEFGKEKASLPPYIIRVLPKTILEYYYQVRSVTEELQKVVKTPIILFLNLNVILFNFLIEEAKQNTPRVSSQIKKYGNILFISAKKEDPYIQELKKVVDAHFIMSQIDRKIILYGKNPATNLFAVNFDISEGIYSVRLIPIV